MLLARSLGPNGETSARLTGTDHTPCFIMRSFCTLCNAWTSSAIWGRLVRDGRRDPFRAHHRAVIGSRPATIIDALYSHNILTMKSVYLRLEALASTCDTCTTD